MYKELRETAKKLERDLGLPDGFLEDLPKSDDWSFIIRTHALMEASVSYLLTHHFGDERLGNVFDFMELSDKRRGKIALVSALDLLPLELRRFLSKLSELRNSLAHDVKQVGFDLRSYVQGLNKDQFEVFVKAFGSLDLSQIDFGPNDEDRREWFAFNAKSLIFRYAVTTMALAYIKRETAERQRQLNELAVAKLTLMVGEKAV